MSNKTSCTSKSVCMPSKETIWYSNSYNLVTWQILYSGYIYYDTLDFYFYYEENYKYFISSNFTNIKVNNGYYSVFVDNNWFPNNSYIDKTWNYTLLVIGSGINPENEIYNQLSTFPKINFNIIQNITNNNGSISPSTPENNSCTECKYNENNIKMQPWKIITITICCVIIIILFISFLFYKKRKLNKQKAKKDNIIEVTIIEHLYQKPDDVVVYQKLNCKD